MNVISELESLMREEQELLLAGNFKALEALVQKKSQLAEKLSQRERDVPEHVYRRLAEKAKYNESLLEAARRGLQAAISQLRQSGDPTKQSTYSKTGERRPLSRSPSAITQKI